MGLRGASVVMHRKHEEDFGDFEEERGGSTFGARWGEMDLRAKGAAQIGGQMKKLAWKRLRPSPYVKEPLNS